MNKRPRTAIDFLKTPEGKQAHKQLLELVKNDSFHTESTYSPNKNLYPTGVLPFEDKHINYLLKYPNLEVASYIANLKVRVRTKTA